MAKDQTRLGRPARSSKKPQPAKPDPQTSQNDSLDDENLVLAGRRAPPTYRTEIARYRAGKGSDVIFYRERTRGHRVIYQVMAGGEREIWVRDPHQAMAEFLSASLMRFYEEYSQLQESFCEQNPAFDQKHGSDYFSSPREWAFITFFQDLKKLAGDRWRNKILESWWCYRRSNYS